MFGYVRPSVQDLPEGELNRFRTMYCGLCHTLSRRYGQAARFILNYDFTYLAILLSDGTAGTEHSGRCYTSPIRKRPYLESTAAMELAADESVILAWWQLRDGVADHGFFRGLKYRLALWLLTPAYRKAKHYRADFDRQTAAHLTRLTALEKERCPSLDAPADAFASLLAGAAAGETDEPRRRVTEQLLYHLGRWVYLIDAADDLADDLKSGSYNPLALRFTPVDGKLSPADEQTLAATLDGSVRAMAAAFELTDCGVYTPVIRSVVYEGLYAVGASVLAGTFLKREEPIRKADTDHA